MGTYFTRESVRASMRGDLTRESVRASVSGILEKREREREIVAPSVCTASQFGDRRLQVTVDTRLATACQKKAGPLDV